MTSRPQRQGDVLFIPINKIPKDAKAVTRDNRGRIVLAEGEKTGHAHAVCDPAAELFAAADLAEMSDRFVRVIAKEAGEIDAWRCLNTRTQDVFHIPAYEPCERVEALPDTEIIGREAVVGVVVEHEEHVHTVLPSGDWVVRQKREYQPEAPRRVMD